MKTITNFWNHFQQNNFLFLFLNEIPQKELFTHFNVLVKYLHQYNKDLNLIIKNKKKGAELIITANGNPYLFKEVELLVHYAPLVESWKITAFLQPESNLTKYENGTDKPLEYYGITLRISEMYFYPLQTSEKPTALGIRIYINNYIIHQNNPKLQEAVYIHLEHLLGEKVFANELTYIDIKQRTQSNHDYFELCYLSSFIEDFKSKLNNI